MKPNTLTLITILFLNLTVESSDYTNMANETRCVPLEKYNSSLEVWRDFFTKKRSSAPMARSLAAIPASDRLSSMRREKIKKIAKTQCQTKQGFLIENNQCAKFTEETMEVTRCVTKHIWDEKVSFVFTGIHPTLERQLTFSGIIISEISLAVLLATYNLFKDLQTSYGKCIVILSITTMAEQLIQVLSLSFADAPMCTIMAITHHWVLLVLFFWTASIAYDLCYTFSKARPQSKIDQRRRFKIYACISEIIPAIIVLTCVVIEYSSEHRYIGYGLYDICFITGYWADIITFVVPVGCILAFNLVCLCITVFKIKSASKRSETLFRKKRGNTTKPSLSFVVMAMKLSFVLGMSWVIGYLGSLFNSVPLIYVFLVVNSYQGLFIFIAFCFNKKVFHFYKSTLGSRIPRLVVHTRESQDTRETTV